MEEVGWGRLREVSQPNNQLNASYYLQGTSAHSLSLETASAFRVLGMWISFRGRAKLFQIKEHNTKIKTTTQALYF